MQESRTDFSKFFLQYWWEATVHGVKASWFGWAGAAGSMSVAMLFNSNSQLAQVFINMFSAFAIVLVFNVLLLAPLRAYRMLKPFSVRIESGYVQTQYPSSINEAQKIGVVVKNKSYKRRDNCVLHVVDIDGLDNVNHSFPRLIEEFSIGTGDLKQVNILNWTARDNLLDDPAITFCGPVGWGWGGNFVQVPTKRQVMKIRISAFGAEPFLIACAFCVEDRKLKGELL